MEWRAWLRQFGIRFAISLLVLGAAYLAIFGLKPMSHNKPNTPPQKIAALQAALDETYLTGNDLSGFKESDSVTASTLSGVFSQYQAAISSLQTTLKQAPTEVNSTIRNTVQGILQRQEQAVSAYQASYTALSQVITYDPSTDLGKLDITKNAAALVSRATAAQNGLTHAANYTPPSGNTSNSNSLSVQNDSAANPVTSTTKKALLAEAACFGQLAGQLNAQQTNQATSTRNHCISTYPALRLQAVQNITGPAFSGSYQNYMDKTIPPLLETLNKLAKH